MKRALSIGKSRQQEQLGTSDIVVGLVGRDAEHCAMTLIDAYAYG